MTQRNMRVVSAVAAAVAAAAAALLVACGSDRAEALANGFGGPPLAIDVATGSVPRIGDYSYYGEVDGLSRDGRYLLVGDRSVELDRLWRVDVIPPCGERPRLVARYADSASWNR